MSINTLESGDLDLCLPGATIHPRYEPLAETSRQNFLPFSDERTVSVVDEAFGLPISSCYWHHVLKNKFELQDMSVKYSCVP